MLARSPFCCWWWWWQQHISIYISRSLYFFFIISQTHFFVSANAVVALPCAFFYPQFTIFFSPPLTSILFLMLEWKALLSRFLTLLSFVCADFCVVLRFKMGKWNFYFLACCCSFFTPPFSSSHIEIIGMFKVLKYHIQGMEMLFSFRNKFRSNKAVLGKRFIFVVVKGFSFCSTFFFLLLLALRVTTDDLQSNHCEIRYHNVFHF